MDQDNSPERKGGRLIDAVRKARIAEADRSDVVVEMREATRTRLELLAQDLQEVIDDVPADDDRFDFALSSGLQPRFWIDATAHVMMGPDRRTYRFVRDTRLGRVVLAGSADRAEIAEAVIAYIAARIQERELVLAGEPVSYRDQPAGHADERGRTAMPGSPRDRIEQAIAELRSREREDETPRQPAMREPKGDMAKREIPPAPDNRTEAFLRGVLWALLGAVIGSGTMLLAYQDLLFQR